MHRICFAAVIALVAAAPLSAAETFLLTGTSNSGTTWLVVNEVTGKGTFEFQQGTGSDKPASHPIELTATFRHTERRLPSAGRDEAAYRSLRNYEVAKSEVRVGGQLSSPSLRNERSRIVVRIDGGLLSPWSPQGPLTPKELELLPSLGDPLLLSALLPDRAVAVGENWTPAAWVGPALAGAEVALNGQVNCQLDAVRDGKAIIRVTGKINVATKGATSETKLDGVLHYDLKSAAIANAELTQIEERSIGPLMPGMSLTLKSAVRRTPAPASAAFSDADLAAIPATPPTEMLRLEHLTSFGVALQCDREWMPFHQTGQLLVLRLLDRGGLIAQCNLTPAPTVTPGKRTSDQEFQEDIVRTLGDQLTKILSAEEVRLPSGPAIYRVTAVGSAGGAERVWKYYLVTAAGGQQAALVFTAEPATLDRLGDRDMELVKSLVFVAPDEPTPAAPL